MSEPCLHFRPLEERDFEMLVRWLAEPEIARWWTHPASLDDVRTKYLPRIRGSEPVRMWIVEVDGVPAGLLQSYRHSDHAETDALIGIERAVGVDYLLAGSHRGRGIARPMLAAFSDLVLDVYRDCDVCVAAPPKSNEPSWRALESAGFQRFGCCDHPIEGPQYVYIRSREPAESG
ncbi:MAG: GNAT family N-acetyltransferase [Acidimicrobiales bacterium]